MKSKTTRLNKKFTKFRPKIRSRHPSHRILRTNMPLFKRRTVIRLGSTTVLNDTIDNGGNRIELNKVFAIKNSSSKLLMKKCFTKSNVKTADWWIYKNNNFEKVTGIDGDNIKSEVVDLVFPLVAKSHFGSRCKGNYILQSMEELEKWMKDKNLNNYIFEKFYNYNREYRLHVTKNGCFYTCRKMLKQDTPEEKRWFRNDSNSVWIMEDNEMFDRPINWNVIVDESIKALNSIGLDFGAIDLRIQSAKTRDGRINDNPDFIIVEINSAPSFGEITGIKYIEELTKLINEKIDA